MQLPPTPKFPAPPPPAQPQRASNGWWGIGSAAAAASAVAMLPVAVLSGKNWIAELGDLMPLWGLCCILAMISGIKGMSQRRPKPMHRILAFAGTMLALITFVLFTIITVIVAQ